MLYTSSVPVINLSQPSVFGNRDSLQANTTFPSIYLIFRCVWKDAMYSRRGWAKYGRYTRRCLLQKHVRKIGPGLRLGNKACAVVVGGCSGYMQFPLNFPFVDRRGLGVEWILPNISIILRA